MASNAHLPLLDPVAGLDDSTKIHMHFGTWFAYWQTYGNWESFWIISHLLSNSQISHLWAKKMFTHLYLLLTIEEIVFSVPLWSWIYILDPGDPVQDPSKKNFLGANLEIFNMYKNQLSRHYGVLSRAEKLVFGPLYGVPLMRHPLDNDDDNVHTCFDGESIVCMLFSWKYSWSW